MGSVTVAQTSHFKRFPTGADLIWTTTMMQPVSLAKECQLSHWDPVCHRPHLTHRTVGQTHSPVGQMWLEELSGRAVHLELSLDIRLWLYCATPSMSPHRIKPSAAPSDNVSSQCWETWCGGWRGTLWRSLIRDIHLQGAKINSLKLWMKNQA